tara:strand:+ start:74 stop:310 length:237 start_codon:yes stop_codon:yes gene_type:complete
MEILYFSSGILTVALAYAVVGVFKLKQRVEFLEIEKDQLHNLRQIEVGDANRRIDEAVSDIYRAMDSRLDKLEHRLVK